MSMCFCHATLAPVGDGEGNTHVTRAEDIPDAPLYVTMIDPVLSGFRDADEVGSATACVYIFPCRDRDEAEIVLDNAQVRGDQDNPRIVEHKPIPGEGQHVMVTSREINGRWYRRGGFAELEG